MWDELHDLPEDDLRHSLIDRVGKDFAHNRSVLDEKALALWIALATSGVEVLLVALALVLASIPTFIVFIAVQKVILKGIILPTYK